MADIKVAIEDAQPINVSLGEAVNVYEGGTGDYNELVNTPDLTLKADKSDTYTKIEVDTSLAGKAELVHVHAISDVTGLQMALDGKQPVGDYATTSELVEGLNTKQPTGDYATNTSLTAHTSNTANPHGVTKSQVGLSNVPNLDTTAAVANRHTHANKAVLDVTTASFTTADESKLDGIATGATANATDAQLRDRTTHTGTQAVSTVTGLQTALDGKAADSSVVKLTGNQTIAGVKTFTSAPIAPSGTSIGGVSHLTGVGFPNGVVSASVGSIYIDTAVTNGASSWIKKSGTGNTGWQVLDGDTGWRDVESSLLTGLTKSTSLGRTLLRRKCDTVYFNMKLDVAQDAISTVMGSTPIGFRASASQSISYEALPPPMTADRAGAGLSGLTVAGRLLVTDPGNFVTTGVSTPWPNPGTVLMGGQYITENNWPTTLPGTAA